MARVMDYNALQITKLYENYLEEYQTVPQIEEKVIEGPIGQKRIGGK